MIRLNNNTPFKHKICKTFAVIGQKKLDICVYYTIYKLEIVPENSTALTEQCIKYYTF